jgi:hypothetical protein
MDLDDGLPIYFSWPILPSSIHCLVIFDDFFNRQLPGEEGRLWMEELEIIGPLMLVGPNGNVTSAEGLTWKPESSNFTSYVTGPVYLGARLVPLHMFGEGGPPSMVQAFGAGFLPNSGVNLYGEAGNLFRLRLFYSGAIMTPDGLSAVQPTMYDDYFTIMFKSGQELSASNTQMTIANSETQRDRTWSR